MEQISAKEPDLVEFRLDELNDTSLLDRIVKKKTCPVIATDKSGRLSTTPLLDKAAALGFDFIDIGLELDRSKERIKQLKSQGVQVIVSYHDYSRTPPVEELGRALDAQREMGGDICKIVTTANQPRDNLIVLDLLGREVSKTRLVAFAMGSAGTASRVLAPLFGAEFTFASLTKASKTAEGQLSVDNLRSAWQILGIQ
jgi:3-dehydroquinate dehydratase type I